MKTNKGFTLIELLVVIAIIGLLSSIVLASLGSARNKGKDAAIKGGLSSLRSEVELNASDGNYANICVDIADKLNEIASDSADSDCDASTSSWAATVQLVSNPSLYWCVDSQGASQQTSAKGADATVCPEAVAGGGGAGAALESGWSALQGDMDWDTAVSTCAAITEDGGEWQLPTIEELRQGIADDWANGAGVRFANDAGYWSSTGYDGSSAWSAYWDGDVGSFGDDKTSRYSVRCVR